MKPGDVRFKSIQRDNTLMPEQEEGLHQLAKANQAISRTAAVYGGLGLLTITTEGDVAESFQSEDGTFVVYHSAFHEFFEDSSL